MPEGEERAAAAKRWSEAFRIGPRMYFGRKVHGESIIRLHDSSTRERIRIIVDAQCQPGIEILDENGNVVDSLPRKDDLAHRVAALEAAVQRLREMVGK